MALGTNYWKLGLFVVLGLGAAIAIAVVLGARSFAEETVEYKSYFDESVQGLEVGAPVKFRGVTLGRVSAIDIAPDQRHVAVTSELSVKQVGTVRLAGSRRRATESGLRVQLSQTGITGVKFLLVDYFDPVQYPAVALPFPVPENHIPATPSTLKSLEDSVMRSANRFPEITAQLTQTLTLLNALVVQVAERGLPAQAAATLDQTNRAMKELETQLAALDAKRLSEDASKNLQEFNSTLVHTNRLLERLDSDQGLLRSAERTADAMAEVARGAHSIGPELEATLRDMRGAARSIRRFADTLERDPDMLLKGRAERRP